MEKGKTITSKKTLLKGAIFTTVASLISWLVLSIFFDNWLSMVSVIFWIGFSLMGLNETKTGYQRSIKNLGARTGDVILEGINWLLPVIYSGEDIDARDKQIDVSSKNFLSRDNVPVSADVSCITGVTNVALSQTYSGDFGAYIKKLLEESVRRYMLNHDAMASDIFKSGGTLTSKEHEALRNKVAQFKQEIESNGREEAMKDINKAIEKYGRYCDRVVIENIRLPEDIEGAGGEALREMLESGGDDVDWDNTLDLAKKSRQIAYDDYEWRKVEPSRKAEIMQVFIDQILAKKGQGTRISIESGGKGGDFTAAAALIKGGNNA